jgi:hypothetical protein
MGTPTPRWLKRLLHRPRKRSAPASAGVATAAATRVASEASAPMRSTSAGVAEFLGSIRKADLVRAFRETAAELDAEHTASGAVLGDPFAALLRRVADKLEPPPKKPETNAAADDGEESTS